ncbi:MAG: ABC transporter permease [Saccharofermentanales bacterium]
MNTVDYKIVMDDYKSWQKNQRKTNLKYLLLSILGIFSFLTIWFVVVRLGLINERLLPSPVTVLNTLIDKFKNTEPDGNLLGTNILASLQVALSGFGLAVLIGIPLGLLMGWYKPVEAFFKPIFELARPIPPVAWIPIIVVGMGIGLKAKAVIIFFSAFVPCVINSHTGVKLTNQVYINVAKTFGASNAEIFYKVAIPYSLPMVFAGLRVALGNSWSTLVAAEMLAAVAGLGYMIQYGRNVARPDLVIAGMFVIGMLGALMSWILSIFEKRLVKGYKSVGD